MVITIDKSVTASATPEAIATASDAAAAAGYRVSWATIQSRAGNTGTVKIRAPLVNSPVGYTMSFAGESIVLWSPASLHAAIDLTKVFIEVSVDGEGVSVTAVK